MRHGIQHAGFSRRCRTGAGLAVLTLLASAPTAWGGDLGALCGDRAAIERVYYSHRSGTKPPFEQAMPPEVVRRLVAKDLQKEAVLRNTYGEVITPAMVAAEVQRIQATTRAPEVLAELQHALGDDPDRFARSLARPIVVERELRRHFDNDDALHAPQRREAEQARTRLLAQQTVANAREVTWQLTPRPVDNVSAAPTATQATAASSAYRVEATAQLSQVIATPAQATPGQERFYFEDLDPELQNVLRAQLRQAGDVSAVIETPGDFLVVLAREKTDTLLRVATVAIPKRSYEAWLAEQPGGSS